tara:strand:+ start:213 stop:680 length:468 start_codon:yes stop_codon:yes gene_type:complete
MKKGNDEMVSREDIIGTWLMVDRGTDDPSDEAASLSRYGPDPQGLLIISAEGWMNAAISWSNRPGLTGDPAWHTDAPNEDRLRAYDTYISYGGRWTLENDTFTTQVDFALNPSWVGGVQVRGMEMLPDDGLKLTLSRAWPDGKVVNAWVRWRRAS